MLANEAKTPRPPAATAAGTATAVAAEATVLASFVLVGDPGQAGIARHLLRAALEYHGLGRYTADAQGVASELFSNAVQHASPGPADMISLTLALMKVPGRDDAVGVVVSDSSPVPPVKRRPRADSVHGRGLQIVEALSAYWGWRPRGAGKDVYAILAGKA